MSKTRTTEHGKISKGDNVRVKGMHGRYVVYWFDHFDDPDRQVEVTVVGGSSGRKMWRTFHDDAIVPMPKRRRKKT